MAKISYLGLGCNLGQCKAQMIKAKELLANTPGIIIKAKSSLYETEPWGLKNQPNYYNGVLKIATTLKPLLLLSACWEAENALGRQREIKWGPRTMDIDILLYASEELDLPRLKIPHPYMTERLFVLKPLLEISPDLLIPGKGPAADYLKNLPNQGLKLAFAPEEW